MENNTNSIRNSTIIYKAIINLNLQMPTCGINAMIFRFSWYAKTICIDKKSCLQKFNLPLNIVVVIFLKMVAIVIVVTSSMSIAVSAHSFRLVLDFIVIFLHTLTHIHMTLATSYDIPLKRISNLLDHCLPLLFPSYQTILYFLCAMNIYAAK